MTRVLSISLAVLLTQSACTVGPTYRGPPKAARHAIETGHFARETTLQNPSTTVASRWWDDVNDPVLSRLIDESLTASPRLKSALARVRSARAQFQVDRARLLPTGRVDGSYARAHIPTNGIFNAGAANGTAGGVPNIIENNLYSIGFDASWELDIFGGRRRQIESSRASAESDEAAFYDAQVQLAGEVGKAYVQLREAQKRQWIANAVLRDNADEVQLGEQQHRSGTLSAGELGQRERQVVQARAELPALQFAIDQQLDQLAILSGREPGSLDGQLTPGEHDAVEQPLPPDVVAISAPYDWLRNRPDIRQSERTLAAQNAKIGQNMADYYPRVRLLGLIGFSGTAPSGLVHGSPASVGLPSLSWNLLGIPTTRARVRGAEADRDQAAADYERRVLEALQDANDSLSRFGHQRDALLQRQAVLAASEHSRALTQQRRDGGTATQIDLLDADKTLLSDQDQLVQSRSQLMQAYVSLQKSLGLGWSNGSQSVTGLLSAPSQPANGQRWAGSTTQPVIY